MADLYDEARDVMRQGHEAFRNRNTVGARDRYERALDLFRRAQREDTAQIFADELAKPIALVQRNIL
ncbi:hypothetical protein [Dichotomicrobium thermohalophilum]|uniref:Tetratricopeptide repeat protein n=1 Tax=Dichotomicrobium thermohalophilum TaxID=933063 RepID=A0A397Q869_9HYPH|nr:hypothetical protein [Dichotomicrobium thermohalophilum]RIA55717.1 hypothetical protein BXY53_0793 [Dichotomicrobium thermohalophilum]